MNRCGMDCLELCYCKEKVKTINEELYSHCPGDCDRNWQKIDGKCNTSKIIHYENTPMQYTAIFHS